MAGEVTGGAGALPVPEDPEPLLDPSVGRVSWPLFQTRRGRKGNYWNHWRSDQACWVGC